MDYIGVISDTHLNNWTAFSETDEEKINSRLRETLAEIRRCAEIVKNKNAGYGGIIVHCGDLFHVKGSVPPSVLIPTLETLRMIEFEMKVEFHLMTGNHDLEFQDNTASVGSYVSLIQSGLAQNDYDVTQIRHVPNVGLMVPWRSNIEELKKELKENIDYYHPERIFMHAPIDGVIKGLPNLGLDAEFFEKIGYEGIVLAGHYHNHKKMSKNVYSVGALVQHSWSDIGSKAGFVLVNTKTNDVSFCDSMAPKFVDITGVEDEDELYQLVPRNYVRLTTDMPMKEAMEFREILKNTLGAKAVVINAKPSEPTLKREGMTFKAETKTPMKTTIANYIDDKFKSNQKEFVEEVKKNAFNCFEGKIDEIPKDQD